MTQRFTHVRRTRKVCINEWAHLTITPRTCFISIFLSVLLYMTPLCFIIFYICGWFSAWIPILALDLFTFRITFTYDMHSKVTKFIVCIWFQEWFIYILLHVLKIKIQGDCFLLVMGKNTPCNLFWHLIF